MKKERKKERRIRVRRKDREINKKWLVGKCLIIRVHHFLFIRETKRKRGVIDAHLFHAGRDWVEGQRGFRDCPSTDRSVTLHLGKEVCVYLLHFLYSTANSLAPLHFTYTEEP